jgi:predicted  nucleic acid-binding Zn-ribbon protein
MSSFSTLPRTPAAPPPVQADEGSLKYLRGELAKAISPAYAGFMAQYDALAEVIPGEDMRFKAALKASKTTVADLANALDGLTATLTATHDKFSATYEASKKKAMDAANAQVEATQRLIETRTQQLAAIQAEIQSLQGKLQTDTEAAQNEERRIEGTRAGFEAAYAQVAGELNAQKAHVGAQPRN